MRLCFVHLLTCCRLCPAGVLTVEGYFVVSPLVPPPEGAMSALYLLLVLPLVSAQTYHWGPCPTPKVQPGFNLEKVDSDEVTLP